MRSSITSPVLSSPSISQPKNLLGVPLLLVTFYCRKNTPVNITYGWYLVPGTTDRTESFCADATLPSRACSLLTLLTMEYSCDHCHSYKNGDAYRVTCDEYGLLKLDMIVCYECYVDARRLGLCTTKWWQLGHRIYSDDGNGCLAYPMR
jgi:hypothetical protein